MEIIFPIAHTICPVCGSFKQIANEVLKGEIEKGKAGWDSHAYLFNYQSGIVDQRKPILSMPVIFTFYDACVDCGTVYCIRAELNQAMPQMKKPTGPLVRPSSN